MKSSWMPLSNKLEKAEYYRRRQFIAVLQVIPLASVATYFVSGLGLVSAWSLLDHSLLICWALAASAIASCNLFLWGRYLVENKWSHYDRLVSNLLVFNLALAALLYAYLSLKLFAELDDYGRVSLIATLAAFAATGGWMFACMPLAGILWSLLLTGTFGVGLLATQSSFQLLAFLAILYSLFLCATVLITSHRFIQGLMAETKIEQQGEMIGLLLHEFEENVSDWLWEIDSIGLLRHVSIQLVDATDQTTGQLKEQTLLNTLESLLCIDPEHPNSISQLEKIQDTLQQNVSFKELLLPVLIKQKIRWWSFKAKPLFNEQGVITGWRGVTSDVTEARTRELEMTRIANQDSLTGLANRYQFINLLNDIMSNPIETESCFLMMLDVDNFKNVNDSLGHHAGDQLLCHLASQLQSVKPKGALLARLGGDEFALIITHIDNHGVSPADAAELGIAIQTKLAKPFNLHGHKIEAKVSIGVSFAPDDTTNPDDLLKAADMALYHAKEERNKVSFFTESLKQKALRKQTLLNDLPKAIKEQQFFLMYQPQYDLSTNQVVSFEALVRWQHPSLGLIAPNDFIPLAESSRLIIPLGEWVLQQACCEAMNWPEAVSVAVNISAKQLKHSDLGKTLEKALVDSGLRHHRLELELTESSIMHDSPRILNMLSVFRTAGGRVAIDDFGTGFSSFSYLHSFPLDKLKIDRSFIDLLEATNIDNQAQTIVNSIVQLGKALNLQVTAEGIETCEQQQILKALTCDLGQGYLFAKPMPAGRIKSFINKQQ
jgi:diguanylate cyclase (GGDEF)-like protein